MGTILKVPGFLGLKLCPVSSQEVLYSAYSVPEHWVNKKRIVICWIHIHKFWTPFLICCWEVFDWEPLDQGKLLELLLRILLMVLNCKCQRIKGDVAAPSVTPLIARPASADLAHQMSLPPSALHVSPSETQSKRKRNDRPQVKENWPCIRCSPLLEPLTSCQMSNGKQQKLGQSS